MCADSKGLISHCILIPVYKTVPAHMEYMYSTTIGRACTERPVLKPALPRPDANENPQHYQRCGTTGCIVCGNITTGVGQRAVICGNITTAVRQRAVSCGNITTAVGQRAVLCGNS